MDLDLFEDRLEKIENPNEISEILDDIEFLIGQIDKAVQDHVGFGHWSNEMDSIAAELDQEQHGYETRMRQKKKKLKQMKAVTESRMEVFE